jgi:hypothetical protein
VGPGTTTGRVAVLTLLSADGMIVAAAVVLRENLISTRSANHHRKPAGDRAGELFQLSMRAAQEDG